MATKDPVGATLRALIALAVLAIVAAGWFGWRWWSAANDDELTVARERDSVLASAADALVALNTVDYRSAEQDVGRWLRVTTGQFGKDLTGDQQLHRDRAKSGRTVATAAVQRLAVTELDARAGKARLLAVLDVTLSANDGPPAPNRSRLTVDLNRTDQGWKVSAVQGAG